MEKEERIQNRMEEHAREAYARVAMSNKNFVHVGSPITKVIEECSEVIHILCKIERFGLYNFNPLDPDKKENRFLAEMEFQDLEEAIKNLRDYFTVKDMENQK